MPDYRLCRKLLARVYWLSAFFSVLRMKTPRSHPAEDFMISRIKFVLALIATGAAISPLCAEELTVKDYQEWKQAAESGALRQVDKREFDLHLGGLGEGIEWANAWLANLGRPQLYCQPPNLALNVDNYIKLIDVQIGKAAARLTQERLEKLYVGVLLLDGLAETFPCSAQAKTSTVH
jgi:hypothetical protein